MNNKSLTQIQQSSLGEESFSSHFSQIELLAKEYTQYPEPKSYEIPERYNIDTLTLLPVNPQTLFLYWEISSAMQADYGINDETILKVCIKDEDEKVACFDITGTLGSYYTHVTYRFKPIYAQLLLRVNEQEEIELLRSKSMHIPLADYSSVMSLFEQRIHAKGLGVLYASYGEGWMLASSDYQKSFSSFDLQGGSDA